MNDNRICPLCGANLVLRHGKYGDFIGCTSFPKCKYSLALVEDVDEKLDLLFNKMEEQNIRNSFLEEQRDNEQKKQKAEFNSQKHKINPCPFCKSKRTTVVELNDPYPDVGFSLPDYTVECSKCGAHGPIVHSTGKKIDTYNSAIDKWNRCNVNHEQASNITILKLT